MKRKNRDKAKKKDISGFRELTRALKNFMIAAALVTIVIILPLSLVWKQVYITNISRYHDTLLDSLAVLNKEIDELNIKEEQLSSIKRIEYIAENLLELSYPLSKEIIVVPPEKKAKGKVMPDFPFWDILHKSTSQGKDG